MITGAPQMDGGILVVGELYQLSLPMRFFFRVRVRVVSMISCCVANNDAQLYWTLVACRIDAGEAP